MRMRSSSRTVRTPRNVVLAPEESGVANKQLIGTGLWEDQKGLPGQQHARCDLCSAGPRQGFASFSQRYSAKFGTGPVAATLSYDATALVAALVAPGAAALFR